MEKKYIVITGACSVDDVASKLFMSRRTLQRRLTEEGLTFKDILAGTRMRLAKYYLERGMETAEIVFLLGYQDTSAFIRAFSKAEGMGPWTYRKMKANN